MNRLNHTPGPWSVFPATIGDNKIVRGPDGQRVCLCDTASPHRRPQGRSHEPQDRAANACLIAAAPEMLAMLERCREYIQNGIEFGYIRPATDPLDKATGLPGDLAELLARLHAH